MKLKLTLLSAFMLTLVISNAQTAKWIVKPQYASIGHFSADVFKCTSQSGKVQLIDRNGKPLLPENAVDAVTAYSDGYAIALQGNKIIGFLSEAKPHAYQMVNGDYFITDYPFFSEGFLAVANAQGKMGYMNPQGQIAIECKYEKAHPFRMGRASVVEPTKKQVLYINQQGKTNNPDSFHGGKLTKGSSFNENGEAVVANYRDYAVINTSMKVLRKIEYTSEFPVRQCDYAYSKGVEDCRENDLLVVDYDPNIKVFSNAGAFGYRWELAMEETVIPAQFNEAGCFADQRAIASKGGKYGVLEQVSGQFQPNWPSNNIRVYTDGVVEMQFALAAPASLESNKIGLLFDNGDGHFSECNGLRYNFKVSEQLTRQKSMNCTLRAKAVYTDEGNELLLWEGTREFEMEYITINLSSPSVATEYADENDMQTVKAVITNTSDVTIQVSATLNVGGKTSPFNGELKPNQSKTLSVVNKVDEDKSVQATVTAKVDGHNYGSKSSVISLKKI